VLDAADEDDVRGAHRDLTCSRGRRRQRSGAHAVDGEPRNRFRETRQKRDVAAERQPLVADLSRGGEHDVVDSLGRKLGVAAEDLAYGLDGHVVGSRLREVAVWCRPAECGANAVDVHHLTKLSHEPDDTSGAIIDREERSVRESRVLLTAGENVRRAHESAGGIAKVLCSACGSQLWSRNPQNPAALSVRMGAFDSDPGVRPSVRQFVAYAAEWEPIPDDGLPRYPERRL
jgi:hypothetical protein